MRGCENTLFFAKKHSWSKGVDRLRKMLKNSQEASFIIDNEIANPYNIRCQKEDF